MAKGGRRPQDGADATRIQYVPVIIPATGGRTPSRAVIEKAVRAAAQTSAVAKTVPKQAPRAALARAASAPRGAAKRRRGQPRRATEGKPGASAEKLDAQLDNYMGDEARKERLDTELDSYFAQAAHDGTAADGAEAGEIVAKTE